MSVPLAALIGLAVYLAARSWGERRAALAGAGAGLATVAPIVIVPALAMVPALWWRHRLASARQRRQRLEADVPLLAELTLLGLRAGQTFPAALDQAADEVVDELRSEVRRVVRTARQVGLSRALESATGPTTALLQLAVSAAHTGAPLGDAVAGHVVRVRHDEHARRQAEARKLPVRLLLPVSLLILPGFIVLVVAPAVLTSLDRLRL
jgi:tight adherence protein C